MASEKILDNLVINYLTEEQYKAARDGGTLNEDELYLTLAKNIISEQVLRDIVQEVILETDKKKYPIGTLELNTSGNNPNTYLGFGTWVLWGSGKVPVGVDINDTDFNTVEKTGGDKTHQHIGDATFAIIDGKQYVGITNNDGFVSIGAITQFYGSAVDTSNKSSSNATKYHTRSESSLQPYITCYMWKRTA